MQQSEIDLRMNLQGIHSKGQNETIFRHFNHFKLTQTDSTRLNWTQPNSTQHIQTHLHYLGIIL